MVSIKITTMFKHLLYETYSAFLTYNLVFQESFKVAICIRVIDISYLWQIPPPKLSRGTQCQFICYSTMSDPLSDASAFRVPSTMGLKHLCIFCFLSHG